MHWCMARRIYGSECRYSQYIYNYWQKDHPIFWLNKSTNCVPINKFTWLSKDRGGKITVVSVTWAGFLNLKFNTQKNPEKVKIHSVFFVLNSYCCPRMAGWVWIGGIIARMQSVGGFNPPKARILLGWLHGDAHSSHLPFWKQRVFTKKMRT